MSGTIRDVYLVPLYDPGNIQTIQVVDVPDNTNSGGVIFDGFRRSILWINGGVINSLSVDDDTASTLVDLCE